MEIVGSPFVGLDDDDARGAGDQGRFHRKAGRRILCCDRHWSDEAAGRVDDDVEIRGPAAAHRRASRSGILAVDRCGMEIRLGPAHGEGVLVSGTATLISVLNEKPVSLFGGETDLA